jgi:hypothetical protein
MNEDEDNWRGLESVSNFLLSRSVVSVEKIDDNEFCITEECDGYFYATLDREGFRQWIKELQELLD